METIYRWRNSTHGTFPSLISLHGACHFFFVLLQSLESRVCADFPRKDKQSVVTRLWITKLNKHFYERRRISACETSVLECSVCFHSIVFFQCQSLSVLWINSYACTVLLTHIHTLIYTQTSTHTHTDSFSHTLVSQVNASVLYCYIWTNFLAFSAHICFLTSC